MNNLTTKDILELWHFSEFLNQYTVPEERKISDKLLKRDQVKNHYETVVLRMQPDKFEDQVKAIRERKDYLSSLSKKTNDSSSGSFSLNEIYVYLGSFEFPDFHRELIRVLNLQDKDVEDNKDRFSCAAIGITEDLIYIEGSLQISPLLYVLYSFEHHKKNLSISDYQKFCEDVELALFPEEVRNKPINLEQTLKKLYKRLDLKGLYQTEDKRNYECALSCKISSEEEEINNNSLLIKSFFLSDLEMLIDRAEDNNLSLSVEKYIHSIASFEPEDHIKLYPMSSTKKLG